LIVHLGFECELEYQSVISDFDEFTAKAVPADVDAMLRKMAERGQGGIPHFAECSADMTC